MNQTLSQEPIRLVKRLFILYFILYPLCLLLIFLLSASTSAVRLSIPQLMEDMVRISVTLLMPILFAVHVFCFYGKGKTRFFLIGAYVAGAAIAAFSTIEYVVGIFRDLASWIFLVKDNNVLYARLPMSWQTWFNLAMNLAGLAVLLFLLVACFSGEKGIRWAKKLVLIEGVVVLLPFLVDLGIFCWMVMTNTLRVMLPDQVSLVVGVVFLVLGRLCSACSFLPLAAYIVYWRRAAEKEKELLPGGDEKTVAL